MTGLPENVQDMIDDFAFLDDWEDRYTHVIELGKALPALQPQERNEATKVKGCVSQVWLVMNEDADRKFHFRGDSDAHIVKGLVAVVLNIYSGRTPAQIIDIDAKPILDQLGLAEHLSPQRANGLAAMIGRIKDYAKAA